MCQAEAKRARVDGVFFRTKKHPIHPRPLGLCPGTSRVHRISVVIGRGSGYRWHGNASAERGEVYGAFDPVIVTKRIPLCSQKGSLTLEISPAGAAAERAPSPLASRSQNLQVSIVFGKFANITKIPELRQRLIFTLTMLAIYRLGVFITVPGVNRTTMSKLMASSGGGLMGLLNLFTGGALQLMSIFALGIMPYISASIIMQMMGVVVPAVDRLKKEGQSGQKKISQYTRYLTVLLSGVQGFLISSYLLNLNEGSPGLLVETDFGFRMMTVLTLTTGALFMMWLGEQITEHGLGNGISLLITAGIIAQFPVAVLNTFEQFQTGSMTIFQVLLIVGIALVTTAFIVYVESAQRRIPLQYAKRMVGRRIYGGQQHNLPLKVNMAGVMPPIFASSFLVFPTTVASYFQDHPVGQFIQVILRPGDWRYGVVYVLLNVLFCFFWVSTQYNVVDMADNLRRSGAYIPGIRPGKKTAEYLDDVMTRLTVAASVYISAVCLMPFMLQDYLNVSFYFGGTSLLIIVSVGLDTVTQIESHLLTRHYDDVSQMANTPAGGGIKGRDRDNEQ